MRTPVFLSLILAVLISAASAQGGDPVVRPAQVLEQVTLLRAELDLIRLEMGRPGVEAPAIRVGRAEPREVYFQALTLFRKADRLAFEHTRERENEPELPPGEIEPKDVRRAVIAALERVRRVKEVLGVLEVSELVPADPDTEPSQVFNATVAANRELNRLLDRKFAPGDVYQQVTTSIAYMSRLLDRPGAVSTPPQAPPLERRKRPADVFDKLVMCFDEVHQIGQHSGIAMLELMVNTEQVNGIEPSDVYDVASLLVSELAYLHAQLPDAAPPRKVYNPGKKLPSHVYQRIGILCDQMKDLESRVRQDPDWLKP